MRSAFLQGFNTGIRQWRIASIVYFLQLCLALTLGMQVYDVLEASIGHSLEINKLLQQYDHTVITDFLKVHGASITPLIGQLRWLLLGWLLFSVFIDGGLLYCAAVPEQASGRSFWENGAAFFFPFLKIGLFFLFLTAIWTVLLLIPLATFFQELLFNSDSEKYAIWLVLALLLLWLTGLAVLFLWSVLSRLQRIKTGASIFGSVRRGWIIFRKNKFRFFVLLAAFAGLQLLLAGVYFLIEAYTGMVSPFLILLVFVLQQAFVFFRVQMRQMMYAGINSLS